jgi:hypothetical protein
MRISNLNVVNILRYDSSKMAAMYASDLMSGDNFQKTYILKDGLSLVGLDAAVP